MRVQEDIVCFLCNLKHTSTQVPKSGMGITLRQECVGLHPDNWNVCGQCTTLHSKIRKHIPYFNSQEALERLSITQQHTMLPKKMGETLLTNYFFKTETVVRWTNPCKLRTHFFCFFDQVGFQHVFCTFGIYKPVCCVQCLSLIHPSCSFFYVSSMLKKTEVGEIISQFVSLMQITIKKN